MLPFLVKKNQGSGVIVKERQPDQPQDISSDDEVKDIEHCVSEAIKAYKSNDIKALARHIKDIHDVLHAYMEEDSSQPHSYDAQNEAAADKE